MTHELAALLLPAILACTVEAPPKEATKVFDFSGSELTQLVEVRTPNRHASIKAQLRDAIRNEQPALLGCYIAHGRGAPGSFSLGLHLSGGPNGTLVESVDVGTSFETAGDALVDCIRDTAMTIEFAPMTEPGDVLVNYPFTVGA